MIHSAPASRPVRGFLDDLSSVAAGDQEFNLLKDDEAWFNDEGDTTRGARSSNSQTRNNNPELSTIQPADEAKLSALKPSKKMLRDKIRKLRAKN